VLLPLRLTPANLLSLSYVSSIPLAPLLTSVAAITLTTWHMVFATIMTQFLARFTTMLDSRKKVPMTGRVYLRAIVPIGVFFSLSLAFSNMTYIHLSVAFIQMLKVHTPPFAAHR
jgi:hypothetical protein